MFFYGTARGGIVVQAFPKSAPSEVLKACYNLARTSSSGHPVGPITMIPELSPLDKTEIWKLHHSKTPAIVFSQLRENAD